MHQQITLVGNLGKDAPVLRQTQSGKAVTNFSIATNKSVPKADGSGYEQKATWWKIQTWDKSAENAAKFLVPGQMVVVVGEIVVDETTGGPQVWQDKNGSWRASLEVRADRIQYGPKPAGANGQPYSPAPAPQYAPQTYNPNPGAPTAAAPVALPPGVNLDEIAF